MSPLELTVLACMETGDYTRARHLYRELEDINDDAAYALAAEVYDVYKVELSTL